MCPLLVGMVHKDTHPLVIAGKGPGIAHRLVTEKLDIWEDVFSVECLYKY